MKSRLEELQQAIADKLRRTEALRGTHVVLEKPATLDGKIDEKIFSKLGVSVIVRFPQPTIGSPNSNPPRFSSILVKVRVVENIPTNRLGSGAAALAEAALRALSVWLPPVEGVDSALQQRVDYPWYTQAGSATTNAVELAFTTSMTL